MSLAALFTALAALSPVTVESLQARLVDDRPGHALGLDIVNMVSW